MASGKPIVTTNLPALKEYSQVIKYTSNREDFIKAIGEVLKRDKEEEKQKRIEIAKTNSWDKRINSIMELINKHRKEKASIG